MLDFLYFASFVISLPIWLALILAPRGALSQRLMRSQAGLLVIGALYLFVLVGAAVSSIGQATLNLTSPAALGAFLSSPATALVIWLHIWVADLAAAYYILIEADKLGMSTALLRVIMLLTLLLAPFGVFFFAMWRVLTQAGREAGVAAPGAVVPQNPNTLAR